MIYLIVVLIIRLYPFRHLLERNSEEWWFWIRLDGMRLFYALRRGGVIRMGFMALLGIGVLGLAYFVGVLKMGFVRILLGWSLFKPLLGLERNLGCLVLGCGLMGLIL